MFVENYRLDTMIGGQAQSVIPYPKIPTRTGKSGKHFSQ
jgi:hypothetical protein